MLPILAAVLWAGPLPTGPGKIECPNGAEPIIVFTYNVPFRLETLDVMTFDEAGKIVAMKAYWGPFNIESLGGGATGAAAAEKANAFLKSLGS